MTEDVGKAQVKDLVEAISLYPRNKVSNSRVADLEAALKFGVKLPPLVVEDKTMRIVDGVHRSRAYQAVFGADYEVEVLFRTYASDQEFFFDAVKLNATHGLTLMDKDRVKIIFMASRLKISKDKICTALSITTERMAELRAISVKGFTPVTIGGKKRMPRGGGIDDAGDSRHWEGQPTLPSADVKQMTETSVQQVINFLKNGDIDVTNLWMLGKLKELYSVLGKVVGKGAKK